MRILEIIVVIVVLNALGIAVLLGIGFFTIRENFLTQKIKEMDKMEEFFKNNKKVNNDLDSFFSEQWKPYVKIRLKKHISATIIGPLLMIILGMLPHPSNGQDNMKVLEIFIGIAEILFLLCLFSLIIYLLKIIKYNKAFPKARKEFQKLYPSYTNQKLSQEIVKCDSDRIEIVAFFPNKDTIWLCKDFLLFCKMNKYKFEIIKYTDIEYILVDKQKNTSYRDIHPNLEYTFHIYYRINNYEKKFNFNALSTYPLTWEFKKKNVEVSEVSND